MIVQNHPKLSIRHQCELIQLNRSSFYYAPLGVNAETLGLIKNIDRVFTAHPFFGSRQIAAYLVDEGIKVGRHRVRRLMRLMGLEAIYKRPNTSKAYPQHPVYPFAISLEPLAALMAHLLRKMKIDRPNQVWCSDITYIPVKNGCLYLVAIMDWATRKVLSWRLSNTLHADFCVEALDEAIAKFGAPEIMNTDQGSPFTGHEWTGRRRNAGVNISMDGRGRFLDNIFIERLWRSLNHYRLASVGFRCFSKY